MEAAKSREAQHIEELERRVDELEKDKAVLAYKLQIIFDKCDLQYALWPSACTTPRCTQLTEASCPSCGHDFCLRHVVGSRIRDGRFVPGKIQSKCRPCAAAEREKEEQTNKE